jgi:hypothetical protein
METASRQGDCKGRVGHLLAGEDISPSGLRSSPANSTIYRVRFTDRAELLCDESHLLTVRTPKGDWRFLTAGQIIAEGLTQPNGMGATGKPQIRYRHQVPIAPPLVLPEAVLPVDPYLIGYLLGDGHLAGTPRIAASPDEEHPWEAVLPPGCHAVHYAGSYDYGIARVPQGRHRHGHGNRENPLTHDLRQIGLWGCLTRDKFIPDIYLEASLEQRWALLQGLNDSDGSARVGGSVFGNTSEKLIDGAVELIRSLGGLAYKRMYGTPEVPFWHLDGQFEASRGPVSTPAQDRRPCTKTTSTAAMHHRGGAVDGCVPDSSRF